MPTRWKFNIYSAGSNTGAAGWGCSRTVEVWIQDCESQCVIDASTRERRVPKLQLLPWPTCGARLVPLQRKVSSHVEMLCSQSSVLLQTHGQLRRAALLPSQGCQHGIPQPALLWSALANIRVLHWKRLTQTLGFASGGLMRKWVNPFLDFYIQTSCPKYELSEFLIALGC